MVKVRSALGVPSWVWRQDPRARHASNKCRLHSLAVGWWVVVMVVAVLTGVAQPSGTGIDLQLIPGAPVTGVQEKIGSS